MWDTSHKLIDQVFQIVNNGGHVTHNEVMAWTNERRKQWFDRMKRRAEEEREAADKAKRGSSTKNPSRPPGGRPPPKR